MRIFLSLVTALMLALPGYAKTATPDPARAHMTVQERFDKANTTHDGHLTLEQAKAGYKSLVPHFADMDLEKRGYVTIGDIRAYYKAQRAHHRSSGVAEP